MQMMISILTNLLNKFDFDKAVYILKRFNKSKYTKEELSEDIVRRYLAALSELENSTSIPKNGVIESISNGLKLTVEYIDKNPTYGRLELVLISTDSND